MKTHSFIAVYLLQIAFLVQPVFVSASPNPLESLAKTFGIRPVPHKLRNKNTIPLYLKRLYESLSDDEGRILRAGPYHSNTMTGYPDSATNQPLFFSYNVTRINNDDRFRFADFHLFRLRPKLKKSRKRRSSIRGGNVIKLKLYQVTDPRRKNSPYGNILLSQKRIPSNQFGWIVFEVSQAVLNWIESSGATNKGLAVFATYTNGGNLEDSELRFVQRGENRDALQPSLILYSMDQRVKTPSSLNNNPVTKAFDKFDPRRYDYVYQLYYRIPRHHRRIRRKRRSVLRNDATTSTCKRYMMYVDFSKVGWDDWIISPTGYNAYECRGICPFPMGQQYSPTNHAVVQGIVSHLGVKIGQSVPGPCCVPSQLAGISMLYYDDSDKVVLKQYDAMIATACGCK